MIEALVCGVYGKNQRPLQRPSIGANLLHMNFNATSCALDLVAG